MSYGHSRSQRAYTAPAGIDPRVYMQELSQQAEALCREGDFHPALRLLQKRLAVVSYYRGSRTLQAAQAMAKLAYVTRDIGNERDANTWAYYAMRAYAALMMDGEARHKQQIAEGIAMLDQDYPSITAGETFQCSGVPDFTSGRLQPQPLPHAQPARAEEAAGDQHVLSASSPKD
jgi:hypothetical protein